MMSDEAAYFILSNPESMADPMLFYIYILGGVLAMGLVIWDLGWRKL